jgi:hypothetical protein
MAERWLCFTKLARPVCSARVIGAIVSGKGHDDAMSTENTIAGEIAELQKRLADLNRERADVIAALEQLERSAAAGQLSVPKTLSSSLN